MKTMMVIKLTFISSLRPVLMYGSFMNVLSVVRQSIINFGMRRVNSNMAK